MSVKPITVTSGGGGDFEQIPAGAYVARLYKIVYMGTMVEQFGDEPAKGVKKVNLTWELLTDVKGDKVTMKDSDKPFVISKMYTMSTHKKASLRADIEAWLGKRLTEEEAREYQITDLIDDYCLIQVVHKESNGKTYSNVGSIMSTDDTPEGVNEATSFSVEDPDLEQLEAMPQWLQDKIKGSQEWYDYEKANGPAIAKQIEDDSEPINLDDIPFG